MMRKMVAKKILLKCSIGGVLVAAVFFALHKPYSLTMERPPEQEPVTEQPALITEVTEKADDPAAEDTLTEPELEAEPASIPTPDGSFQGSAAGAIRMDGKRLFGWETDKGWPSASLTKLMTAIVVLDSMREDELIILSQEVVDMEGDRCSFKAGEVFSVRDLLVALLTVSSNDAAEALAGAYGRDAFIAKMNAWASELGMTDTTYVDPSGLSIHNRTTVANTELLVQYIWKNHPELFAITRQRQTAITDLVSGDTRTITNINQFAGRSDFLGGKTGYLPAAGGNLVSVFHWDDDFVIVTVFGTVDRFKETEKVLNDL